MRFLVIQTAFIGDVVLATPLAEKLFRFFPQAQIDFVVRAGNEGLLRGHPFIRRVWVWEKRRRKYAHLWQLAARLRQERYDWVINCQRFAASGALTVALRARHTVGFDKNPLSWLFSRRVPHVVGRKAEHWIHEVERNLSLIDHLTDDSFEPPRLYPTPEDQREARAWAPADRPWVCVAPTSVWFTKQLPAHKWVALIERIPESYAVLLLGSASDRTACEAILQSVKRPQVYNVAGQLSLLASAALMRGAAMSYVNDSAPLHLASAVDAPVVAVFCSTTPAFGFGPLSSRSWVVEAEGYLSCRPCGLHGRRACPQGHFACAENIRVEQFPLPMPL